MCEGHDGFVTGEISTTTACESVPTGTDALEHEL